jgi:hypothetical protein
MASTVNHGGLEIKYRKLEVTPPGFIKTFAAYKLPPETTLRIICGSHAKAAEFSPPAIASIDLSVDTLMKDKKTTIVIGRRSDNLISQPERVLVTGIKEKIAYSVSSVLDQYSRRLGELETKISTFGALGGGSATEDYEFEAELLAARIKRILFFCADCGGNVTPAYAISLPERRLSALDMAIVFSYAKETLTVSGAALHGDSDAHTVPCERYSFLTRQFNSEDGRRYLNIEVSKVEPQPK